MPDRSIPENEPEERAMRHEGVSGLVISAPRPTLGIVKANETIGEWVRRRKLGAGGNATVWEATRGQSSPVALKVLNTLRPDREPYLRFVREVETMRSLGGYEGVLPLLDAHLPETPRRRDPAWLAMPIANPISEALLGRPLEDVVRAVGSVAETLASLQGTHDLAHRDGRGGREREGQDGRETGTGQRLKDRGWWRPGLRSRARRCARRALAGAFCAGR